MSTLSEKLKSLGVKVGAQDLPQASPANPTAIEQVLAGSTCHTPLGDTFLVEKRYPVGQPHGRATIKVDAPLNGLARWAGDARISDLNPQSFAFLDTETTGLSGGSGTYAFLIGVARFEGDELHLAQFFMRDPMEEAAQLAAFEEFIAPCQAIVSFNGKSFDVPLLLTRFVTQGWQPPFAQLSHLDLLHLARRLWRDRLPSRTLSNLEWQILGALRSEEDVPGWMIPSLYFDYLHSGDATRLKSVFYHNAMDVVSLAALLNHMALLLAHPLETGQEHGVDLIALAKLFEDLGDLDTATDLYIHGLDHEDALQERLPQPILIEAIQRLASIHKYQQNYEAAVALWQQAAHRQHLHAHVELAKYYEHRAGDVAEALFWTQSAIDLVELHAAQTEGRPLLNLYEQRQWLTELRHRQERLESKAARLNR
ncbi:MAG: ribonuclease H-like domain-containing protein [Anaerolineales bacterium]|nr:ribonuclease H-like domain-containing protein [Anaerolineales bacterium]